MFKHSVAFRRPALSSAIYPVCVVLGRYLFDRCFLIPTTFFHYEIYSLASHVKVDDGGEVCCHSLVKILAFKRSKVVWSLWSRRLQSSGVKRNCSSQTTQPVLVHS